MGVTLKKMQNKLVSSPQFKGRFDRGKGILEATACAFGYVILRHLVLTSLKSVPKKFYILIKFYTFR